MKLNQMYCFVQKMQPTYEVTVGKIKCAYFDKVNTLKNFGTGNKESVAELLTYFFEYWASCHDYNRAVISVRTGGYLRYALFSSFSSVLFVYQSRKVYSILE